MTQTPLKTIKGVQNKIEELANFASANKNVHREVKQMAVDLKRMFVQALKEIVQMQKGLSEATVNPKDEKPKETINSTCQTEDRWNQKQGKRNQQRTPVVKPK